MLRALWKAFTEPPPPRDDYDRRDGNGSIPPPPFEGTITVEVREEWIGPQRYEELCREEAEREAKLKEDRELRRTRLRHNPNGEPVGFNLGRCEKCHSQDLWDTETSRGCNYCGMTYPTE